MKLRKALYIFVLVLLAVFLIQVILAQSGSRPSPTPTPSPSPSPLIGGCAGTRYGCCPDGRTPRANYRGTNCD